MILMSIYSSFEKLEISVSFLMKRVLCKTENKKKNVNFLSRDVFVTTMQPQSKHIVIMMDHGNSLSQTQLHTAKSIAKNLIASFTENDRVCIKLEIATEPLYRTLPLSC